MLWRGWEGATDDGGEGRSGQVVVNSTDKVDLTVDSVNTPDRQIVNVYVSKTKFKKFRKTV